MGRFPETYNDAFLKIFCMMSFCDCTHLCVVGTIVGLLVCCGSHTSKT